MKLNKSYTKHIFLLCIAAIFFLIAGCAENANENNLHEITEVYQTSPDANKNVDSPAFWHNGEENITIVTAKSSHQLLVYNAIDGSFIREIGKKGTGPLEFSRPNGITVMDNFVFVVERDNKRIQVLDLPGMKFIGFVTDSMLIKPYGISVIRSGKGGYTLFVTDNYEVNDSVPPDSLLGRRIHKYTVQIENDSLTFIPVKTFGAVNGEGVLRIVESIYADTVTNSLLIAEEDTDNSVVKVYDLDGNYKNISFGKGIFKFQVEGIALYEKDPENGFWIVTDQDRGSNRFQIFDRNTFKYITGFYSGKTQNTDGICLTQHPFGKFNEGAFFAINDDRSLSAFDLSEIIRLSDSK